MERNEIIEVLDAGNEGPVIHPDGLYCCGLMYAWYRG